MSRNGRCEAKCKTHEQKSKSLSQIAVPFWVRFCPIVFDQELGQENFASLKFIAFVQGGADQVPQDPKAKTSAESGDVPSSTDKIRLCWLDMRFFS